MPERFRDRHTRSLMRYLKTGEASVIGKAVVVLEGLRRNGEIFPLELEVHDATSAHGVEFVAEIRDITEHVEAERELRHRMANQAASMLAMVRRELKNAHSLEDAGERINSSFSAYSSVHNLLKNTQSTTLRELLDTLTRPYAPEQHSERIELEGADVMLKAKTANELGYTIHELATNASKYGVLQTPEGRVNISWELSPSTEGSWLRLVWEELPAFEVKKPDHKGFGIQFIERTAKSLQGKVEFDFQPTGLICIIEIPLTP
jgi:two-component sensor histidine kinase